MADKKTYTVHRGMHGDGRDYQVGDTRELTEADAAELVASGALSLMGEAPKVREPSVRHTFGAAEDTGHLDTTIAGSADRVVTPRRASSKPATTSV